jgi:hypothetical protein
VTSNGSEPQNALEEALLAAATGGSGPEQFYAELLGSELYAVVDVHGEVTRLQGGQATLAPDARVQLLPLELDGERAYAAFTSPLRLEQATGGGVPYASVPAGTLFGQTPRGARLILNPGVWYGKELLPEELAELADGRIPSEARLAQHEVEAGTSIMLGEAADPPVRLIDALRDFFAASGRVVSARLGQSFVPSTDPAPHPVVGVEPVPGVAIGDALAGVEAVVDEAYEGSVDFVPISEPTVGAWLRVHVEPFYEREPS